MTREKVLLTREKGRGEKMIGVEVLKYEKKERFFLIFFSIYYFFGVTILVV